jgi:glycosyltransferase involved in cell wall biosynthesis
MRILQITPLRYPEIKGGVDTMVVNLTGRLRLAGHEVCVFIPGDWPQATLGHRDESGVAVYSLRLRLPQDPDRPVAALLGWLAEMPLTLARLRSMLRRERIDLIHAHLAKDYLYYFRLLRWLGGPRYIVTLHGSDIVTLGQLNRLSRTLARFALRGASRITTVSHWLIDVARRQIPDLHDIECVHNGLEFDDIAFDPPPVTALSKNGLPQRYAIMVGSFDPYKGHESVLHAWPEVLAHDPELHLVIVGEGQLLPRYEELIRAYGLSGCVHLPGQLSRAATFSLMRAATLMILPSHREGFSYALLEAGAARAPVICNTIPSFRELIIDMDSGMLCDTGNRHDLARAVCMLASDAELRQRLGKRLHECVRTGYTAEIMARDYARIYAGCLT